MGQLLEFVPRHARTPEPTVTPLQRLRTRTTDQVRDLVQFYNSTGKWDPATCDLHVVRAIEELYAVCAILAAKIGDSDEQQPPSIG